MAKRKTSKPEGFIDVADVSDNAVYKQMDKMNLLKPEDMSFDDFMDEFNKLRIGILKAINGFHRDIVGDVLDTITEIYIRRS